MTSQRKIEANRRNAKLSTGPKTQRGKTASSKNALKHGLAAADPTGSSEAVADLTAALSQNARHDSARVIAQTTAHISQVRALCTQTLVAVINNQKPLPIALREIERLRRYETRALSKRRKAIKASQ